VNRCYKSLETKNLIKAIQSAKFPTRKIYILSHLQPSEDVTGGPYFTDGALDDEFVRHLALWTEEYVVSHSWYRPPRPSSKKVKKSRMSAEEAEALRSKELDAPHTEARRVFLPYPPGYTGYPTLGEITKAINESKLSSVVMKEIDMLQLMNVLCWDGRVTKVMKGNAYKAARPNHSDIESAGNGLTEAPCGRCPVFDLCEEGGPVNARTCTYFQQWLGY
jgi:DNA-directed RNA polymerase III subunit RPC6